MEASIGIIGGTGIYSPEIFEKIQQATIKTPFGNPSSPIKIGQIKGESVAFLPRHGPNHSIPPSKLPSRANIFALKKLGVKSIVAVSAVGSLREKIKPRDFVIPDQLVDKTHRQESFFNKGIVAHVKFAEPFCPQLSEKLKAVLKKKSYRFHQGGTYVCIEGPQFSTKAESELNRKLGFDLVGMTLLPEAKLAREAELCYAALCYVTDWDQWKESEVSVEEIKKNIRKGQVEAKEILKSLLPFEQKCKCQEALKNAIITPKEKISPKARKRLKPILAKYLG